MTYLKRSNPVSRRNRAKTLAIVALLAIAFLIHFFFPSFYGRILSPFTSAAWKSENSVFSWVYRMGELARSKSSLITENDELRQEIADRDAAAQLSDSIVAENDELRAALGRKKPAGMTDLLGVVLMRPPVSPYDTLIIDVGSDDGVKVGDKVYANGSVLIGDVAETLGNTSKISLFSTPGRTMHLLFGASHVDAEATGRGGGNFMARLPADTPIEKGDAIALPQYRDSVFGTVEEIVSDNTDSLKTVLFKAPVNMHELRFVEVEVKK